MTPERMAAIAAAAYRHAQPWDARAMADALAAQGALLAVDGAAFVLGRVVADEAEILALATDPAHQRAGAARRALAAFCDAAAARGATRIFLEVAARNTPARALYSACGFSQAGLRRGYYRLPDGSRDDALILSRALPRAAVASPAAPGHANPESG